MTKKIPLVGVGVMIFKGNEILLGKRRALLGRDEYAFPGGHLEYMETFEQCGRREIREETGIEIKNIRFQILSNIRKYKPRHYVHIGLIAVLKSGEPEVLESNKCEKWDWYSLDKLPKPLFKMTKISIDCYKNTKTRPPRQNFSAGAYLANQ